MWNSLIDMFHNNNDHKNMVLKDNLRKINMEKGNMIQKYLTKFNQCRDEFGSVGITVAQDDLVSLDLLGLPKRWQRY